MEEELNGGGIIDFTKDLGKKSIEIAARLENKSKELSGKLEGNSKKLYNSTLEKITAEGSIYRTLVDTIKNIEVLNKTIKAGGKSIEVLFDGTKDGLLEEIKSKLKSVVTKEIKNAVEKIPGGSLVITTSCIILKNLLNTIKKEYKEHGVPNSKVESFLDIIDESIDKIENSAEEIKIAKLEKRVDNIEAKFPDTMDQETILDKSVATHVAGEIFKELTPDFIMNLNRAGTNISEVDKSVGVELGGGSKKYKKSRRSVKKSRRSVKKSRRSVKKSRRSVKKSKRSVKKSKRSKRKTMKRR